MKIKNIKIRYKWINLKIELLIIIFNVNYLK